MVLVNYSDSEGSETESTLTPIPTTTTKPTAPNPNFAVDRSNPKKIRVNLTGSLPPPTSTDADDGQPPAKRPRTGAGAFSGFNAMLPAPKRDGMNTKTTSTNGTGASAPARKVFSLKTGAEPAFSRDSDAELRDLFAQDGGLRAEDSGIPSSIPKPKSTEERIETPAPGPGSGPASAKPFMFKPLSVARNTKKKKTAAAKSTAATSGTPHSNAVQTTSIQQNAAPQKPPDASKEVVPQKKEKITLFSSGPAALPPDVDDMQAGAEDEDADEDEIVELLDEDPGASFSHIQQTPSTVDQPESLDSIADSLHLSAAERRQLLGRGKGTASVSAGRVINFNTDAEYIANQQMNAAGEQVQHNPVRAIAPGKHSLKSLVASAQGQKEALEESFASGRKNKMEAGAKYGW